MPSESRRPPQSDRSHQSHCQRDPLWLCEWVALILRSSPVYLIIHKLETKHEDLISVCFSLSLSVCFCVCLINFFLFFVLAYILWVLKFLEKIVGLFWRFIVQDLGCDISFPRLLKSICHTRRGSYYGEVTAYPWVGVNGN